MSFSRHAALMRTIHSRRNSPLRARRSRYAYCSECMTCSLALRKLRLREPEYPWAASSTARRCFLPWTERLTLAISRSFRAVRVRGGSCAWSLVRSPAEQALDVLAVAAGDLGRTAE